MFERQYTNIDYVKFDKVRTQKNNKGILSYEVAIDALLFVC